MTRNATVISLINCPDADEEPFVWIQTIDLDKLPTQDAIRTAIAQEICDQWNDGDTVEEGEEPTFDVGLFDVNIERIYEGEPNFIKIP